MPPTLPPPDDPQARLLRAYTILRLLRADWSGVLLLSIGLNPEGASLALAANLAGAVCLSIEEDSITLKQALRSASCDFIVNTLDEALRTIKNEIRKHQPLSVGLLGSPTAILAEALERGLQPDAFTDLTPASTDPAVQSLYRRQVDRLHTLGATLIDFAGRPVTDAIDAQALLARSLHDRRWQPHSFPLKDANTLRAFETYASSLINEDDLIRRPWLQSAHRLLPRERPLRRLLWVTSGERELLERNFPPPGN